MLEDFVIDVPALIHFTHGFDFLAALFGFVVLGAILMQPLMSFVRRRPRFVVRRLSEMQLLDECAVGLLAVLPLGVMLWASLASSPMSHR